MEVGIIAKPRTFKYGGIHPPENKITANKPIIDLKTPEKIVVHLSQHTGLPAKPVVNKGDYVKTGQIIGEADGFISANIHSPVSGKIQKIDLEPDYSGYKKLAITIETQGDEWLDDIDNTNNIIEECNLSPQEIIEKIKKAGIVGLGGAMFPSHVKLSIPPGKSIDTLIINGVECEPYLTADHRLMLEKGKEIIIGIRILKKALNVKNVFIGIELNKIECINYLASLLDLNNEIKIIPLKVKYPQGGEKQLIQAITGREVPPGGLPADVGVVVFNVATTFAIYEAVQKNKPLIERIITVTGKCLENPINIRARIGTPINKLLEAAGAKVQNIRKLIVGGPMMGRAIDNFEAPVLKGTSGILVFGEDDALRNPHKSCIRCARCVQSCPMHLEPYLLMTLAERKLFEKLKNNNVTDCIECGSCSYICPSSRPLLDYIRYGKINVINLIRSKKL